MFSNDYSIEITHIGESKSNTLKVGDKLPIDYSIEYELIHPVYELKRPNSELEYNWDDYLGFVIKKGDSPINITYEDEVEFTAWFEFEGTNNYNVAELFYILGEEEIVPINPYSYYTNLTSLISGERDCGVGMYSPYPMIFNIGWQLTGDGMYINGVTISGLKILLNDEVVLWW